MTKQVQGEDSNGFNDWRSVFNYIDHLLRLLLIKTGQGTSGTKTGAVRYTIVIQIIQFLFGKESVHHGNLSCHLKVVT